MDIERSRRNRDLVTAGFARFAAGDTMVLRNLLHENFIEHSPGNPSGRDAFIAYITRAEVAASTLDLRRVVADDEFVVMHYCLVPPNVADAKAVVDIWRVVDGLIVEHWDVVQRMPEDKLIPHGML